MLLGPDWRAFFESLLSHDVKFVIVGALAVGVHAEPRYSDDLDVFVEPTHRNAERLRTALIAFGFADPPSAADLADPQKILMLGRKPFRIDVLKSISGVAFVEAWSERAMFVIDGLELPVLGREHLIRNKAAAGRNKDQRDLVLLQAVHHAPRKRGARPTKKR